MGDQQEAGAGRVVVNLPPAIDIANGNQVNDQLTAMLGPGERVVIADLSGTRFCYSCGIRYLLLAARTAAANGAELRLAAPREAVWQVVELTGLDHMVPAYPTVEAALS
jgi:anti-sigma B factor antagonist